MLARQRLKAMREEQGHVRGAAGAESSDPCDGVVAQVGTRNPCLKPGDTFKDCPDCPEMVVVPAGRFTMGSPKSEKDRGKDEGPQHEVTIPKAVRGRQVRGDARAI